MEQLLVIYASGVNVAAFSAMGIDKRRAQQGRWRIRESTLFFLALLGGSVGAILGMRIFGHKTKHWYFKYGMPLILLAQIVLGVFLAMKLGGAQSF